MQHAAMLKVYSHDGVCATYLNVNYFTDSAGLHVRYRPRPEVVWNTADIERMEVDPGELEVLSGAFAEAVDVATDRARDAELGEVPGISIARPYLGLFGRAAEGPADDDPGSDHGC
jgi:hypothetical protein